MSQVDVGGKFRGILDRLPARNRLHTLVHWIGIRAKPILMPIDIVARITARHVAGGGHSRGTLCRALHLRFDATGGRFRGDVSGSVRCRCDKERLLTRRGAMFFYPSIVLEWRSIRWRMSRKAAPASRTSVAPVGR